MAKSKYIRNTIDMGEFEIKLPRASIECMIEEWINENVDDKLWDTLEARMKPIVTQLVDSISDKELLVMAKKRVKEVLA